MVSKDMDVLDSVDSSSREKRWKGVRKRAWGRWVCEIRLPRSRQRVWLGSYATAEEAACAYDAASLCLRGAAASLNFPCSSMAPHLLKDSASHPLPLSREAIQSIAATAAAQCRNQQPNAGTADNSASSSIVADNSPLPESCSIVEARPDSAISSALCIPTTSIKTLQWAPGAMAMHLQSKAEMMPQQAGNADELRVQQSSVPSQQLSRADESPPAVSRGAEDDQCLFSILKELVVLPRIVNSYGAQIC